MKDDEKRFLIDVYRGQIQASATVNRVRPYNLIVQPDFYMHHKRARRILEKWGSKNWYDWIVSLETGWLTPHGIRKAKELIRMEEERLLLESVAILKELGYEEHAEAVRRLLAQVLTRRAENNAGDNLPETQT